MIASHSHGKSQPVQSATILISLERTAETTVGGLEDMTNCTVGILTKLLVDLPECFLDAVCTGHVGGNTKGLATLAFDLRHETLVALFSSRQEYDGVQLGEFVGEGCSGSWTCSGEDGVCSLGSHCGKIQRVRVEDGRSREGKEIEVIVWTDASRLELPEKKVVLVAPPSRCLKKCC